MASGALRLLARVEKDLFPPRRLGGNIGRAGRKRETGGEDE
jgi:hypothetical protein